MRPLLNPYRSPNSSLVPSSKNSWSATKAAVVGLGYSIAIIIVQFARGRSASAQFDTWEGITFFASQYFLPSVFGVALGVATGICASRLVTVRPRMNTTLIILLLTLTLASIQIAIYTFSRSPLIRMRIPTIAGVIFGFSVIHIVFSWAVATILTMLLQDAGNQGTVVYRESD